MNFSILQNKVGNARRRGGRKVIEHWIDVAERFSEIFDSEENDHYYAAACHDSIEDGYCTEQDLREWGASEETISLVKLLTHEKEEDYFSYINRVADNEIARQIKIADIIDNLSDQPTLKQINKYSQALFLLTFERDIVE